MTTPDELAQLAADMADAEGCTPAEAARRIASAIALPIAEGPSMTVPERAPLTPEARTRVVGVRVTEAEFEQLAAVAAEHHLSVPDVFRLSWGAMRRAEEISHGIRV